jgi:uncharacterized protein with PIN domain
MTEPLKCEDCGTLCFLRRKARTVSYKGMKTAAEDVFYLCPECGSSWYDGNQLEEWIRRRDAALETLKGRMAAV